MKQRRSDRIYIDLWLSMKPYQTPVGTDHYYLRQANELKLRLEKSTLSNFLLRYMPKEGLQLYSCFITSYFEDIISETNLWATFVKCHQKLNNKLLPFYHIEDYEEGYINWQDLAFLTWYFISTVQPEKIVYPHNPEFTDIAELVMDFFEDQYEYAPANEDLRPYYMLDPDESDYYLVRHFMDNLLLRSYLFYTDFTARLNGVAEEILADNSRDASGYLPELKDMHTWNHCTRLLAMYPKDWAAEYLGPDHPLSESIQSISKRVFSSFLYKGRDDNFIYLEHITTGRTFNLLKKSYDGYKSLHTEDMLITLGMVQWKGEWWFSGISIIKPHDPNFIKKERKSMESRIQVSYLDNDYSEGLTVIREQLDSYLKFNNGQQIAFMMSGQLSKHASDFIEFYNASIKLKSKQDRDFEKKEGGDAQNVNSDFGDIGNTEPALFFFNPRSGPTMAFGINSAFPMKHNPYFNPDECEQNVVRLLREEEISVELVNFCLENCKKKLPFFKTLMGIWILHDLDFLLRFWKRENYHTRPLTLMA